MSCYGLVPQVFYASERGELKGWSVWARCEKSPYWTW